MIFGGTNGSKGRFEIKPAVFGGSWRHGWPSSGTNVRTIASFAGYNDGQWMRIRTHMKLGRGDGEIETWLLHPNRQDYRRDAGIDNGDHTLIRNLPIGRNLNQGVSPEQYIWWGESGCGTAIPGGNPQPRHVAERD